MEANAKKATLRKYTYAYAEYKDLGKLFFSFLTDLIVMLVPIAIWDAIMIGVFGSVFSISGIKMMNTLTIWLLVVSTLTLNPLICSYTRGQTLGMYLHGLQVMHKSGRRCNMHVIRLREIIGSSIPLCFALLSKQPLLLFGYYGICVILSIIDKKHRTLVDFVFQTCVMKIDGIQTTIEEKKCRFDFHIHSSFSRCGEKSVEDIFVYAQKHKMEMISITDLNTVKHNLIAHNLATKYGIRYLSGIEVKAKLHEHIISILGYGIDYRDSTFAKLEEVCLLAEKEASILRIDAFSSVLGQKINTEELMNAQRFPKVSGETIAKYVLNHEDFKDHPLLAEYREMEESLAYKKLALKYFYSTKSQNGYVTGECYVEENYPSLQKVVEIIKETGGMSILADACAIYESDIPFFYEILREKIDGLEVFRPDVLNKVIQKTVLQIAKDKDLVVLCGSDFYTEGKGRMIGECGKLTSQDEMHISNIFQIKEDAVKNS